MKTKEISGMCGRDLTIEMTTTDVKKMKKVLNGFGMKDISCTADNNCGPTRQLLNAMNDFLGVSHVCECHKRCPHCGCTTDNHTQD